MTRAQASTKAAIQIASFVSHSHPESPYISDDNLQLIGDLPSTQPLLAEQLPLNIDPPI